MWIPFQTATFGCGVWKGFRKDCTRNADGGFHRTPLDRDGRRKKGIPGGTAREHRASTGLETNGKYKFDRTQDGAGGGVGDKYLDSSILYLLRSWKKTDLRPSVLLFKLAAVGGENLEYLSKSFQDPLKLLFFALGRKRLNFVNKSSL